MGLEEVIVVISRRLLVVVVVVAMGLEEVILVMLGRLQRIHGYVQNQAASKLMISRTQRAKDAKEKVGFAYETTFTKARRLCETRRQTRFASHARRQSHDRANIKRPGLVEYAQCKRKMLQLMTTARSAMMQTKGLKRLRGFVRHVDYSYLPVKSVAYIALLFIGYVTTSMITTTKLLSAIR